MNKLECSKQGSLFSVCWQCTPAHTHACGQMRVHYLPTATRMATHYFTQKVVTVFAADRSKA